MPHKRLKSTFLFKILRWKWLILLWLVGNSRLGGHENKASQRGDKKLFRNMNENVNGWEDSNLFGHPAYYRQLRTSTHSQISPANPPGAGLSPRPSVCGDRAPLPSPSELSSVMDACVVLDRRRPCFFVFLFVFWSVCECVRFPVLCPDPPCVVTLRCGVSLSAFASGSVLSVWWARRSQAP